MQAFAASGGKHHDGQGGEGGLHAALAQERPPVDPGHQEVQQNSVGVKTVHAVERFCAIARDQHLVAGVGQTFRQEPANNRLVVDDENSAGQPSLLGTSARRHSTWATSSSTANGLPTVT